MHIPAETLLAAIRKNNLVGTRELGRRLGLDESRFDVLVKSLMHLQERGAAIRLPAQGWTLPERTPYRVGTVRISRKGHAYVNLVRPEKAGDFFISASEVGGAFTGDLVLVEPVSRDRRRRGRPERGPTQLRAGRIVDVVRRREGLVRGRYFRADGAGKTGSGYVSSIEKAPSVDIFIAAENSAGARDGQKVLVRLLEGWNQGVRPRGEVVHVIDDEGSFDSDLRAIAAEFGLPLGVPAGAAAEAQAFPDRLESKDLAGREDLRDLLTVTIDPDDAKDFDDAVSLETLGDGGSRLGVHIADVAAYVRPESVLDEMARARGTSVYLPGRVIPMLPERISNDLASLRPGEDRLAKSVFIDLDRHGAVQGVRVTRSVICSKRRFTYEEVLAILCTLPPSPAEAAARSEDRQSGAWRKAAGQLPLPEDHREYAPVLERMAALRDVLHRRRLRRGALELEIPTLRLKLDSRGDVAEITRELRDPSHHLIEEFMLAANEAVARYCQEKAIPLVSRIHDEPDEDVLEDFFLFLENLEEEGGRSGRSRDLQRIVEDVRSQPYGAIVHLFLLRSLSHAEYTVEPGLHFALATSSYCHFTSPIRRYPDLLVHQALDEHFDGRLQNARRLREWRERLPGRAEKASEDERRAEKAEREMTRVRLIRHLGESIGDIFTGMITSVQPFGLFVQVEDLLFDGLVHISSLDDDYYDFEPETYSLRGRTRKRRWAVGDRVQVALSEVDADLREIRFELKGPARAMSSR